MAHTTSYKAPARPFLRPPSPNTIPNAESVGLTGADAWAYGVSTRLMSDPGRWDLFNQVQAGMVWLDEYMAEIEDRLKGKDDEEVDFVELVKTPGRNRAAAQSHFHNVANAEKLAKINALHFGEVNPSSKARNTVLSENAQVKKQAIILSDLMPSGNEIREQQTPAAPALPPSSTNHTIRPASTNRAEELHVISHTSATPTAVGTNALFNSTATVRQENHTTTSASSGRTASISSGTSGPSGTSSSQPGGERRFGPRPLPAVPGGMRSRAASNVSVMSGGVHIQPQVSNRPPSRATMGNVSQTAAAPSKVMDFVDHKPTPTPPIAVPSPVQPKQALSKQPQPRTPSPVEVGSDDMEVEVGSDDMEVEVEVPLNDMTVTLPTAKFTSSIHSSGASIFPTSSSVSLPRKASYASLPEPSPLRKSVRGANVAIGDGTDNTGRRPSAMATTTPHSRGSVISGSSGGSNTRGSVAGQRTSGWFKSTPGVDKKVSAVKKLDTDEKTALNTAANAAIGAGVSSTVVQTGNSRAGSGQNSLKRKSEAMEGVESSNSASTSITAVDSAGEERASKASKKAGKTFAMERDAAAPTTNVSAASHDIDDDEGDDPHEAGEDDTAERLLKLRGMLKTGVVEPEKEHPREDSAVGKEGGVERPQSRSEFRPISKARNPGDYGAGNIAATSATADSSTHAAKTTGIKKTASANLTATGSPMKVSELVGAWEGKKDAAAAVDRQAAIERKASGFGLPKFLPHGPSGINVLAATTTPPGSPIVVAQSAASIPTTTATKKLERVPSTASNAGAPSIFKAPITKTNIFTAPKPASQPIFTHPASQTHGVSSQSTADEEDTDPLFEPVRNKGKTSTSTFDTMSQPSQDPSAGKPDGNKHQSTGWGSTDEGVTAAWLSKGNDTLGENEARLRRMHVPGAFEEDESNEVPAFVNEDDDTNHEQVAAILALAGSHEGMHDGDDVESDGDRMAVDSQDDEEQDQEEEQDQDQEEDEQEYMGDEQEAEPVAPTPSTGGGLLAQVGSFASKAAFSLKSLRMAAVAAEREKTAKEQKEARLREMDARRQAALQKKADEEVKRREEAERKRKLEEERRKKDKADTTLNRSIKLTKGTVPSSEKKQPELKRVPSKLGLTTSTIAPSKIGQPPSTSKWAPTPTKVPTIKLVGQSNPSSATAALHSAPSSNALTSILGPSVNKAGAKVTFKANSSLAVKANLMGAGNGSTSSLLGGKHVETETVQMQSTTLEARVSEGGIDESADLPDIKSEYSDSEDEGRPRTYNPPGWAQSPDLRQALEDMRGVNPDTIFGAMPQLRMDEIFPGRRKSKFRARTSSANWAGTDGVTEEEEKEYARRMGFED